MSEDRKTYYIMGKYRGQTEKVDTAHSEKSANYLLGEYRLAFGRDWELWIQPARP
jgi:hypothetical protein